MADTAQELGEEAEVTEDGKTAAQLLNEIDEHLKHRGIHHGLPLGLDEFRIDGADCYHDEFIEGLFQLNEDMMGDKPSPLDRNRIPYDDTTDLINLAVELGKFRVRNSWRLRRPLKGYMWGTIRLLEDVDTGKVSFWLTPEPDPANERFGLFFNSGCVRLGTTRLEAEEKAQKRLRALLSEEQWRQYVINDCFMEIGASGTSYILRKNRPTIALSTMREDRGGFHPLCTLCLHPMVYYQCTYVGALPPSDEVIAHLLHIRDDEHFYWRKAIQHSTDDPFSGI